MVVEVEEEATMMRSARTGKQEYMYTHLFQNRDCIRFVGGLPMIPNLDNFG